MPGCGTQWNTFWTHGVCPGCGHAWQDTQCLACLKMSPHRAWYHYPDGGELPEIEEESDIEVSERI
jgi:predicted amidophosphoribosyltransferase